LILLPLLLRHLLLFVLLQQVYLILLGLHSSYMGMQALGLLVDLGIRALLLIKFDLMIIF
jgi:hypothetical protein